MLRAMKGSVFRTNRRLARRCVERFRALCRDNGLPEPLDLVEFSAIADRGACGLFELTKPAS